MRPSNACVCLAAWTGWTSSVYAQQVFSSEPPSDVSRVSNECIKVLRTETRHCDDQLFRRTDRTTNAVTEVLPTRELEDICKPECREELSSLRQKIMETCTSSDSAGRDYGYGAGFPASYFVDKLIYTYDVSCYRHEASGRFCDDVYWDWRLGKLEFDQCDDCYLGPLAVQISSPIGVADHAVSLFEQVKAACPNAVYNVAVAKSWKAGTAAAPKEDTEKCARYYSVKKGDTCASIALSQNLSTVDLIQNNDIDADCKSMPAKGTKLCLAETCETHEILPSETCSQIARRHRISPKQFQLLNPVIGKSCSNLEQYEGYVSCVGPFSLIPGPAQEPNQSPIHIPVTARKPLAPGSSEKCILFVNGRSLTDPDLVAHRRQFPPVEGEDKLFDSRNRCGHVTDYNGVTIGEFRRLNPSLDEYVCYLEEQYSYCLAEEGGQQPEPQEGWDPRWGVRWGL